MSDPRAGTASNVIDLNDLDRFVEEVPLDWLALVSA